MKLKLFLFIPTLAFALLAIVGAAETGTYAFFPDRELSKAGSLARGYGHAPTRVSLHTQRECRAVALDARKADPSLPGNEGETRSTTADGGSTKAADSQKVDPNQIVYITRTGTKYHRQGCRFLAKSAIPITLKDASARHQPCSVCAPPRLDAGDKPTGPGSGKTPTPKTLAPAQQPAQENPTVYVTRTGTKYHRAGCRYLSKSMIPLSLKEAKQRFTPCSVCRPPE